MATSDVFDVATLTTSLVLTNFTFSGANRYKMTVGAYYVIRLNYAGGNVSNQFFIGEDNSSPSHSGNACRQAEGAMASIDLCFYVYAVTIGGMIIALS